MAFVLTGAIQEELITGMMIPELRKQLVSSNFVTTKIVQGADSLKFPGVGAVNTFDYTGSGTSTVQSYTDTSVVLTLDKTKGAAVSIEKIDNEQSAVSVIAPVTSKMVYSLGDATDVEVFELLATTTNTVSGTALDKTNIIRWILDMGVKLDNLKAPRAGRSLAVSPEVGAVISEAIINLTIDKANEAANGYVGNFGGFQIFISLNLKAGATGIECIAAVPEGGVLGLGFNSLDIEKAIGEPYDVISSYTNYGIKLLNAGLVVKSDATVA